MVAIIKSGKSLRSALHYNENKLKQNVARLIHSRNFVKDLERLRFSDKIKTFEKYTSLNERTKLNSVHISLNFDPSENLGTDILRQIADAYMQEIGFAYQPYLVYQHYDSGHPHIHIVTTNIQDEGTRIEMQNIGRNQSERARKKIEEEFLLVQAKKKQLKQSHELKPIYVQKVQYGKSETKRAITNVLSTILPTYRYSSLPELNAILGQYNVIADRGSETSRTFKNNGLVYRVLDDKGQKIGAPIKASDIYNKPGLKYLTKMFEVNEPLKQPLKLRVKNAIDLSFARSSTQSLEQLIKTLKKEKITVVLRQNDTGKIYGITYVDHQTKCVFNGSDLGKLYSANQMQDRCKSDDSINTEKSIKQKLLRKTQPSEKDLPSLTNEERSNSLKNSGAQEIFKALTQTEFQGYIPRELREEHQQKKKKKKRFRP